MVNSRRINLKIDDTDCNRKVASITYLPNEEEERNWRTEFESAVTRLNDEFIEGIVTNDLKTIMIFFFTLLYQAFQEFRRLEGVDGDPIVLFKWNDNRQYLEVYLYSYF
jgi:hypothetical protein